MVIATGGWWLERRALTRPQLAAAVTELSCDGAAGADAANRTPAVRLGGLSAAS
jgi:hypothetical protein